MIAPAATECVARGVRFQDGLGPRPRRALEVPDPSPGEYSIAHIQCAARELARLRGGHGD